MVDVAAGTPNDKEGELTDPAVPLHRLPLQRAISPFADLRAVASTRRLIHDRHPDIVHTHMAKAGAVGRIAASTLARGPRTVHTFHGHVLDGYFGPRATAIFVRTERALARRTDALVAVSPEVRDSLLDLGVGRPSQWVVLPLGLDLSPFLSTNGDEGTLRRSIGVPRDAPLVGVIGRLVPIKDHETLLRAMVRLPGVHLAVIGDGSLRGHLEELAKSLGIAQRTHFTGWWTDIPTALRDLDIVALTSRNEGTPVALIEAAAASKPVVATDVGGVSSVVANGRSGYLVEPGGVPRVADMLGRLVASEFLRTQFGARGRAIALERFTEARATEAMSALYEDLITR